MPPQYIPPDHTPGRNLPDYLRTATLVALALLGLLILWFALTASRTVPAKPPVPAQTTGQAGVSEQRLTLNDGRTLTCLVFTGPAVSCDWEHAFAR